MFKKSNAYKELIENRRIASMQLDQHDADSPEYDKILGQIERLDKMLSREKEGKHISPDALFAGLISVAGIIIIVGYEHLHPIVSKALPFVRKI